MMANNMIPALTLLLCFYCLLPNHVVKSFTLPRPSTTTFHPTHSSSSSPFLNTASTPLPPSTPTTLQAGDIIPDLEVVGLVTGQETYGLAIVGIGEALWSFLAAPSLSHARVLVPAIVAAIILVAFCGPAVTSGDASRVALGLEVGTVTALGLGGSYLARMLAPYSPSAKEIAFLGLLFAVAGFFSFSQNLVVNGFVTLPSLPSVSLPSLPSLPSF